MLHYVDRLGSLLKVEQEGGPYTAELNVAWLSRHRVYLFGALGDVTEIDYFSALQMLAQRGATEAVAERHGRMKEWTL